MMKRRWGRIIQITSIVGATGNPGQGNYAAAKAGLVGMTKSLAAEVASRNITVNAVAPGFIQTAMTEVLTDQQKELINQRTRRTDGHAAGNCRRRGLSGQRGSGLCHRRNHPHQWWDGDDMTGKTIT
jgi:NAD(P)-dependent dehydrogenase (short-subunit alcohol dehydrogenase family)